MSNIVVKVFALNLLGLQFNWTKDGALDWPDILLPDAQKGPPDLFPDRIRTNTLNAHIQLSMDSAIIPAQRDLYIPTNATISYVRIFINSSNVSGHKVKAFLDNNPYGAEISASNAEFTLSTDPTTGLAWTRANLAVRTFGIQLTTIGGGDLYVNVIAIEIGWVPVSPFFSPNPIINDGSAQILVSQAVAHSSIVLNILGLGVFSIDSTTSPTSFLCTPPAGSVATRNLLGSWIGSSSTADNNFGYSGTAFGLEGLEYIDTVDVEFSDPDFDYNISGGLNLGDLGIANGWLVLIVDGSGIYGITANQFYDKLYSRNTTTSDTIDVTIPNPFFETTYFGD